MRLLTNKAEPNFAGIVTDCAFLADALATRDGNLEALSRWPQYMAYFESITLLSAIRFGDQAYRLGLDCHHKLQRAL